MKLPKIGVVRGCAVGAISLFAMSVNADGRQRGLFGVLLCKRSGGSINPTALYVVRGW